MRWNSRWRSLWLRPIRLKAAAAENDRACQRLTQLALDLIRDTRQAAADVVLCRKRNRIALESVKLRARVAELAEKRLAAGDASVAEIAAARIDALIARQEAARIAFEVPLAEERLKNLMGLARFRGTGADGASNDCISGFRDREIW